MEWYNPDGRQIAYLMLNTRNLYTKIGISNNPSFREKTLQSEEPEVVLIAYFTYKDGRPIERDLHRRFKDKRLRGEWFNLGMEDYEHIKCNYKFDPVDEVRFHAMLWGISCDAARQAIAEFMEESRRRMNA